MSKKTYNLVIAVTGGLATLAVSVITCLNPSNAVQINASIVIAETAVLGICNQFVN